MWFALLSYHVLPTDQAHHDTNAIRAMYDMAAFDDAIEKAVSMTSDSDTLTVVTADHSHTMSLGGYPWRGNPILGKIYHLLEPWFITSFRYFLITPLSTGEVVLETAMKLSSLHKNSSLLSLLS